MLLRLANYVSSLSVTHGNRDKRNQVCGIKAHRLGQVEKHLCFLWRKRFFQQYLNRNTEMPSVFYLPLLCKGSKARKMGCTTADPTYMGSRWACPSYALMVRSRISIPDQGSTPMSEVNTKWQLFIVAVFSLLARKRNRNEYECRKLFLYLQNGKMLPVSSLTYAELFHFARHSLFWVGCPQVRGFSHQLSKVAL